MPPSPEQIPVPASSAPRERATLASSESAPKLMSDTKRGMSSARGFSAPGPITSSDPTGVSSNWGTFHNWAVTSWMSSHFGRSVAGTPMAATGPCPPWASPVAANCWMSLL